MSSLPSATTRLSDQSRSAPVSTDLLALIAPCAANADGVPRLYSSLAALLAAHRYNEGGEYAGLHMDATKKAVLLVPIPITTAGAIVRQESMHTGTGLVYASLGADGSLAELHAYVTVESGGVVGTDQILLSLSLDGDVTRKTIRLGTALTYTVPNVGHILNFESGQTLVDGDTVLEYKTTGPVFDTAGVALARTKLAAQQKVVRSWLFCGTVGGLALGQAIETAVNAYETSTERYVVAKFSTRDRRELESSKLRHAAVGTQSLTFAEVGATGDTITRASGSFVTDGFAVGDYIRVTGTLSNNVSGKITAVSATVLTLDTADLVAETIALGTARITGEQSLVFASTTITRNAGSWTAEGFAVGDTVTIAGTASNNGAAIITTLSATVMTCAASTFVSETIGVCSVDITLSESETAWIAAMDALFAPISGSERVDIGFGRLTHVSTITDAVFRYPVQFADSIVSYTIDISETTWLKARGALKGWGIDGEFDERGDAGGKGAIAARFTCARTWANGPEGAFIAKSVTRATDGSALGMTHNMFVANVYQAVVQRETEGFVGATVVLKPDGTAQAGDLVDLKARVDHELSRNLLAARPDGSRRASAASWTPATDDDLTGDDATLHGGGDLDLNGTIVHVDTASGVR